MAFTPSDLTPGLIHAGFKLDPVSGTERSPSLKMQVLTYTVLSTDTSATVTFDQLATCIAVHVDGTVYQTGAATFSTNVATLTIKTSATATGYGTIIGFGY